MARKLPKGWAYRELGDLVRIVSGGTPTRSKADYWGGSMPWITAKDLKVFDLHDSQERLTDAGAQRASVVPENTVLMLVRGMGLFKDVPVGVTTRPMAFNQDIKALHPKADVTARFLGYALQGQRHYLMGNVDRAGHGTGRLPTVVTEELPLPVPKALGEQRRIVCVLDAADRLLETTRASLEQRLLQHEQVVRQLYELGKKRGKRTVIGTLISESKIEGGWGDSAPKLTVKLHGKGVIAKVENMKGSAKTRYYVRRSGQLIYSKLDFINGAIGIIPEHLDCNESTLDLPAFDVAESVNPSWLLGYFTRPHYYQARVDIARGQRIARRVNPDDWLATEIRVPPRGLQDRIVDAMLASKRDIKLQAMLVGLLRDRKRGLMQKLLTGQWRLTRDLPGMESADV
jgi:type I restriction enzyme, S subunit